MQSAANSLHPFSGGQRLEVFTTTLIIYRVKSDLMGNKGDKLMPWSHDYYDVDRWQMTESILFSGTDFNNDDILLGVEEALQEL